MSAVPTISGPGSEISPGGIFGASSRLSAAIFLSVILHAIVLLGVNFQFPLTKNQHAALPLEVVLINRNSISRPDKANAKANLDGRVNTGRSSGTKTPFPSAPQHKRMVVEESGWQETEQFEQEAQQQITAPDSEERTYPPDLFAVPPEQNQNIGDATDLVQRSLEIARLDAQTSRGYDAYQKPPKRKFIGARTQDYRFARYVEDWRLKVERIGNLNYPEAAKREKLYGSLQLTVGIKSDGALESVEINRPSGKKMLDEAAVRIVKLAGQNGFAPFPPDISRDIDVLHITRTWVFTRADQLASE